MAVTLGSKAGSNRSWVTLPKLLNFSDLQSFHL